MFVENYVNEYARTRVSVNVGWEVRYTLLALYCSSPRHLRLGGIRPLHSVGKVETTIRLDHPPRRLVDSGF